MTGKWRSDKGYTITEVLVVLTVIGLLVGLAMPSRLTAVQKAREATLRTNLNTIRTVLDEYYADHLSYPEALEDLVVEGYLRDLPSDTINRGADDWDTIPADEGDGIMDIRSNSTSEALDGTIYADW